MFEHYTRNLHMHQMWMQCWITYARFSIFFYIPLFLCICVNCAYWIGDCIIHIRIIWWWIFSSATCITLSWLDTQSDRYNATQAIFVHKCTWAEQSALYINYSFRKNWLKTSAFQTDIHSGLPVQAVLNNFQIYFWCCLCMHDVYLYIEPKQRAISFSFRCWYDSSKIQATSNEYL